MFVVQETSVEESVATVKFACDLNACKGACCTMPGGQGAPLLDSEIAEIQQAFPVIKKYLSDEHLSRINEAGLFEGSSSDYTTPCYNFRACVFVTYEQSIAKCAFEKAYHKGEIGWRKPVSCHLFPIRIDRRGKQSARFEYLHECRPALERGRKEDIDLSEFVKDALVRAFGKQWYDEFSVICKSFRQGGSGSRDEEVL